MTNNNKHLLTALITGALSYNVQANPVARDGSPIVGAIPYIIQDGHAVSKDVPIYDKDELRTGNVKITYAIDVFAYERWPDSEGLKVPHAVAGHELYACIVRESALNDHNISDNEYHFCQNPAMEQAYYPAKLVNSNNFPETDKEHIEYPFVEFTPTPNLDSGNYHLVVVGKVDGNYLGEAFYSAPFKVMEIPSGDSINILADTGTIIKYARHFVNSGTEVVLNGNIENGNVDTLYIPDSWNIMFLPSLEEWQTKPRNIGGAGLREEFLVIDGGENVTSPDDLLEKIARASGISYNGTVNEKDSHITHYNPGEAQEFTFISGDDRKPYRAGYLRRMIRGGDAGIAVANVVSLNNFEGQPDLALFAELEARIDRYSRPDWANHGTLLHLALNTNGTENTGDDTIVGWQLSYIVVTPEVKSPAVPFIAGFAVGTGVSVLIHPSGVVPPSGYDGNQPPTGTNNNGSGAWSGGGDNLE